MSSDAEDIEAVSTTPKKLKTESTNISEHMDNQEEGQVTNQGETKVKCQEGMKDETDISTQNKKEGDQQKLSSNAIISEEHRLNEDGEIRRSTVGALQYYPEKTDREPSKREGLETKGLRNYNNWVKSVLIKKYVDKVKKYYSTTFQDDLRACVLDVGCGKGGDLLKWRSNGISYYIGTDISGTAVKDAHQRWTKIPKSNFSADFIRVNGAAKEADFFKNIPENILFDIVSSQFVIHYMFSNKSYVENLLNNISRRLLKNGYFICSIPDADVLAQRINSEGVKDKQGEVIVGNQYYSLKINSEEFPKDNPYGIEYGFFLDDSAVGSKFIDSDGSVRITYVSEYVIIPENFIAMAKKYDLELVEGRNFQDFCRESLKDENYVHLLQNHKVEGIRGHPKELLDISYLYKVMAFKKTSGLEMNKTDRFFWKYAKGQVTIQEDEEGL